MHPRYPAPKAERIWDQESRAERMRAISDSYTIARMAECGREDLVDEVVHAGAVSVREWERAEREHGHEIVGFLEAYLSRLPEATHQYVHYRLTSSDLVEFDTMEALRIHSEIMAGNLGGLHQLLRSRAEQFSGLERAGRTHGRTAEITDLGHQFRVHQSVAQRLMEATEDRLETPKVKSPGPSGFPTRTGPDGEYLIPSTQVIPRDYLLEWACVYLRISNFLDQLATFVRLGCRSEIDEFQEGGANHRRGSSAMPGKKNPIDSERVCGLARVARGHFLAISEVSNLWEERDLTNSSTERIALPGLASTVEHMASTMYRVIRELNIDVERISANANHPSTRANYRQSEIQNRLQVGPLEASKIATTEGAE